MKKLAKYLFLAAIAIFAFASCKKDKEQEQPVQVKYTFTAAATSATEAELKVVADNPVTADVTVKLALDAASTLKDGVTFPAELVLAKGKTEVTGKLTVNMSVLPKDGNKYTAIIAATVDGKAIGTAEAISVTTEKGGVDPPTPSGPAVDGEFDDWNEIEGIEGTGALQVFKMQSDDTKMYFYMEVDKAEVLSGNLAFAHKLMLCFDNGDYAGENSVMDVWNDYGFDKVVDIWMMQNGVPNMITWGLDGFAHKEVDGDIQKYEFCFNKSIDPVFSGAMMRYGAFINTQNCDTSTGAEVWSGDANEGIGYAPAADENMATIGDVPAAPAVVPGMIVIDGNPADWEGMENVVSLECPEGAEMTGLLSAKILYGKKLYILAKISDEAIADGKVRLHVYFDTDETGGVTQHWNEANIDYMTEGKITNSGAYVDYSSSLYKWDGTPEEPWKWAACEDNLSYKGAGMDNIYELAINYSKYPGGLPEEFSIGLDVVNSSWAVFGYLPQTYYKLVIKKDGIAEQPEEPAQGPATIADIIKEIPESATGNDTAAEFEANLKAPAVVSYVNGNNAYIQDKTGAILIYMKDHGFVAGDTIKGKLAVKAYWFNGIPEMVAIGTEFEKASGEAPAPKEITIADLLANYDANLLRLIVLKGVTVTGGIADGDRNGEVAQGDNKIAVYAQLKDKGLVLEEGATGDLVTIPAYYKTNKQVYFWDNAWFTAAAAPAANITIDGNFEDWKDVEGVSDGKMGAFKASSDADNIYLYVHRTTEGRYSSLWNADYNNSGYVYFAFNLDGDDTTGESLWGNGPYEFIGCIFPWGAESPALSDDLHAACAPSTSSLANLKLKGLVADDGTHLEFSIPRADLPAIPTTAITITAWGNKDLTKVTLNCTL